MTSIIKIDKENLNGKSKTYQSKSQNKVRNLFKEEEEVKVPEMVAQNVSNENKVILWF